MLLLKGLKICGTDLLEIGSSTGQISLKMAKKFNLNPTLVDNSKFALALANRFYHQANIHPTLICQDAFELSLNRQFDLVHSHGLLEHFKGKQQRIVFQNHVKHVKSGGWVVCWVPTPDMPYRINRWYLERINQWIFGFEEPLFLSDFTSLFQKEGLVISKIHHLPGWLGIAAQKVEG
ncbi:MAG: class I SAM-dependent methyltransferase [Candidatus Hodarchaeales archaeon]